MCTPLVLNNAVSDDATIALLKSEQIANLMLSEVMMSESSLYS